MMSALAPPMIMNKTRLAIIKQQFAPFFRAAALDDHRIELLRAALDAKEICAFGIYLARRDEKTQKLGRVYELEIRVDWQMHKTAIETSGEFVRTSSLNYDDVGEHTAIREAITEIEEIATEFGLLIYCWLRLSSEINADPSRRKEVLNRLGFNGGPPPDWETVPEHFDAGLDEIEEVGLYCRQAPSFQI